MNGVVPGHAGPINIVSYLFTSKSQGVPEDGRVRSEGGRSTFFQKRQVSWRGAGRDGAFPAVRRRCEVVFELFPYPSHAFFSIRRANPPSCSSPPRDPVAADDDAGA